MAYQGNPLTHQGIEQVLARRARQGWTTHHLTVQNGPQQLGGFHGPEPGAVIESITAHAQTLQPDNSLTEAFTPLGSQRTIGIRQAHTPRYSNAMANHEEFHTSPQLDVSSDVSS
jgi:hypothetical protein